MVGLQGDKLFSVKRIRSQMYLGVITLVVIVLTMFAGSMHGLLKFRNLTKKIREHSQEYPLVAELGQQVSDLRSELWQLNQASGQSESNPYRHAFAKLTVRSKLVTVEKTLNQYRLMLAESDFANLQVGTRDDAIDLVEEFYAGLERISSLIQEPIWVEEITPQSRLFDPVENELANLQNLVTNLPSFMQARMEDFSRKARAEFMTLVAFSVPLGAIAGMTLCYLIWGFRNRIAQPLEALIAGSREVAAGNYDYRIELKRQDEISELASAFNEMTGNFQKINLDLNQKVQQRTKEVVQSEKMASVGFLAAGVAHEINNPLATIAWSAESLEMRLIDLLQEVGVPVHEQAAPDVAEMLKYLRRIQDEAFRCKGITAGLLDFSRMGDVKKVATPLADVIETVIDMVKPLSKYRDREIRFSATPGIECICNAQEMKQVVLNLITNALGSVEPGGKVEIELKPVGDQAELKVKDNGCGMTEEVLQHLFEPFFTRRRDGQGTGLGLSITYQIIAEHGGQIRASSAGPGLGSVFTVQLPLAKNEQSKNVKVAA